MGRRQQQHPQQRPHDGGGDNPNTPSRTKTRSHNHGGNSDGNGNSNINNDSNNKEEKDEELCRFFILHGRCRFGRDCAYSHTLPTGMTSRDEAKSLVPCPFYARGACRYGEHCQLRHDPEDIVVVVVTTTGTATGRHSPRHLPPATTTQRSLEDVQYDQGNTTTLHQKIPAAATAVPAITRSGTAATIAAPTTTVVTCGICLEDVISSASSWSSSSSSSSDKNGGISHSSSTTQFGLLSGCDHAFCLDCLMEWRKEGSGDASVRRSCPTCRTHSDYVVPSYRMPLHRHDKDRMLHQYKSKLSKISCHRFVPGRWGSCPFGSDCFYAHCNAAGQDVKARDKSLEEIRLERQQQQQQQAAAGPGRRGGGSGSGSDQFARDALNSLLTTGEDIDVMLSFLRLMEAHNGRPTFWFDDDDQDSDYSDHSDYFST